MGWIEGVSDTINYIEENTAEELNYCRLKGEGFNPIIQTQNKLIRRFVPKGLNIGKLNNADVKRIESWMNNYPRKILGYKSPNQIAA